MPKANRDKASVQLIGIAGWMYDPGDIKYDMMKADYKAACSECGCGGLFKEQVIMAKIRLPKVEVLHTVEDDWICTHRVAKILIEKHRVRKNELIPIKSASGSDLKLFVIQPRRLAGPMHVRQSRMRCVKELSCKVCQRRGYYHDGRHSFVFPRESLEGVAGCSLVRTWECSGKSEALPMDLRTDADFPRPYMLVSASIAEFFVKESKGKIRTHTIRTLDE